MPTSVHNLKEFCAEAVRSAELARDRVRADRQKRGYVEKADFLAGIRAAVSASLPPSLRADLDRFEIQFVERAQFGADVTFRSTELIKADKNRYMSEICPNLSSALSAAESGGTKLFETVEQKGIYVNAKFSVGFLFASLAAVESQGSRFGENAGGKGHDAVIEYSSPNAAKHLHAGHIRSTIIGHAIANLVDACGYATHRINYLNDWGGMGFLLEGLNRRRGDEAGYANKNDFLFEIYSSFRKAEKLAGSAEEFAKASEADFATLAPLFGRPSDHAAMTAAFADFKAKSDARFRALESDDGSEFADWRTIVEWSLADFERFYDILDVRHDLLSGESLYAELGKTLVTDAEKAGGVTFFDQARADAEISELATLLEGGGITEDEFAKLREETLADVGAYVVELSGRKRYVVLKGNGSTIYATRDLAALKHRIETYRPDMVVYEVGQEQQDHFQKLFESAEKIGFGKGVSLRHVYHGFYVNEETKKKLSSRDGASNILKLLDATVAYFEAKYADSSEFSDGEKRHAARALGVGSIVFNDLKRDKKSPIGLSSDFEKIAKQFEESGGAYVVYSSCRAKSILRKYGKPVEKIADLSSDGFLDQEADLMKKILEFPDAVERAAANDDPVRITEYLLKLSALYNAYYHAVPVLKGDNVEARVALAAMVAQTIDNGLRLLHVEPLERI